MKKLVLPALFACLMLHGSALQAQEQQVGHMVFFKLKDNSMEAKKKLVEACKKYLSKHEGTVYFSAGILAEDFKRDVNDRDFDVALHLVFKNRAAHDKYQDHPQHLAFINENKDNWASVRVFDSYIEAVGPAALPGRPLPKAEEAKKIID